MSLTLIDTTAEAEVVLMDLLRQAPIWKRLELVDQMFQTLQCLAASDLRRLYPQATEQEIRYRLAARFLSPQQLAAAYGPLQYDEAQ